MNGAGRHHHNPLKEKAAVNGAGCFDAFVRLWWGHQIGHHHNCSL